MRMLAREQQPGKDGSEALEEEIRGGGDLVGAVGKVGDATANADGFALKCFASFARGPLRTLIGALRFNESISGLWQMF